VAHFNLALLLAYLHFPLSNGYLIVEVLDYSVLPCFELETLALIYALRRFRIYLQGKHVKLVSDCIALKLTLNKAVFNPKISRWALETENYDLEICHRAGKKRQHVDALSRYSNILIVGTNRFE